MSGVSAAAPLRCLLHLLNGAADWAGDCGSLIPSIPLLSLVLQVGNRESQLDEALKGLTKFCL